MAKNLDAMRKIIILLERCQLNEIHGTMSKTIFAMTIPTQIICVQGSELRRPPSGTNPK